MLDQNKIYTQNNKETDAVGGCKRATPAHTTHPLRGPGKKLGIVWSRHHQHQFAFACPQLAAIGFSRQFAGLCHIVQKLLFFSFTGLSSHHLRFFGFLKCECSVWLQMRMSIKYTSLTDAPPFLCIGIPFTDSLGSEP